MRASDTIDCQVELHNAFDRGEKDELSTAKLNEVTFVDYQRAVGSSATRLSRGQTNPLDPQMTVQ